MGIITTFSKPADEKENLNLAVFFNIDYKEDLVEVNDSG